MKKRVYCGLDRLEAADAVLKHCRIGLMTAPSGVTRELKSAIDVVAGRYRLSALFAAEHGIRGDAQAGVQVPTHIDPETGVPAYSVYGTTKRLTDEMLNAFDVFLYDMQCVGVRFWTFLYSLAYAMQACAEAGKPVVVLDRLNPIAAGRMEGTILDPTFRSFVGDYQLPSRHGLTVGEFARYVKAHLKLDLDLTVVPLEGYSRGIYLDDTDTPWVAPSPNCPSLHAALCYVGTSIFEGTNVSEGRGTTLPFELIGAPWLDAAALEKRMAAEELPGVHFRRTSFVPTFSKHQGTLCHGVQMHITDREIAQPVLSALVLMNNLRAQAPDQFEYRSFEEGKFFIDRLLGTDAFRLGLPARALIDQHRPGVAKFRQKVEPFLLYS